MSKQKQLELVAVDGEPTRFVGVVPKRLDGSTLEGLLLEGGVRPKLRSYKGQRGGNLLLQGSCFGYATSTPNGLEYRMLRDFPTVLEGDEIELVFRAAPTLEGAFALLRKPRG